MTLREILQKIFGLIPGFKSKNDLLEEEFAKLVADFKPTVEANREPIARMESRIAATLARIWATATREGPARNPQRASMLRASVDWPAAYQPENLE
jgi:hypothetical protein